MGTPSFSGRAPHFLGVVPQLLLLPVFTGFFWSSSSFSGVVKETPDFSLASPDFPEALHLFSVLLKSSSLFWCSPAFSGALLFFPVFFESHPIFLGFIESSENFSDSHRFVRCFPGRFALSVV